ILQGMPLTHLYLSGCPNVSDLTPLRGMRLTELNVHGTAVRDLTPLKGMRLTFLHAQNTGVTDLTPLTGMPLEDLRLTPKNSARGLEVLRDMKSLKTIGIGGNQAWPAAEFWARYDKGEFKK